LFDPDNYAEWLNPLEDLALTRISHAGSMCVIHFGDLRPDTNHRGQSIQIPEWALQLQCPWRFTRRGKVVLGSTDFFRDAKTGDRVAELSVEGSVFLHNRDRLHKWMVSRQVRVESVTYGQAGAFDLQFCRDLCLNVMPDFSHIPEKMEDWRLFQPGMDKKHFVYPTAA